MDHYLIELNTHMLFFDLVELVGLIKDHGSDELLEYIPELEKKLMDSQQWKRD